MKVLFVLVILFAFIIPQSSLAQTCFDGIQNQTETGIDCGGPCISCIAQSNTTSQNTCPASAAATIYARTCDQIGTTAYGLSSGTVTFQGGTATTPTPAPGCASGGMGTWARYDLDAGVTTVIFTKETTLATAGTGTHNVYGAFYQGTCGALSLKACMPVGYFSSGSFIATNVIVTGLNPAQDLYVYVFDNASSAYTLPLDATGVAGQPSNDLCASAAFNTGTGCNLGAIADASWTGPSNNGRTCSGGTWYSNENTVWYTLVASGTSGTVNLSSVVCESGSTGQMQFGLFTSCACAGTYTAACFKACAVGSGTMSLTGLTAGTTYYLAVDGQAGTSCKWNFNLSGNVSLPVSYVDFSALEEGDNTMLKWLVASEDNAAYYEVERSLDGSTFERIASLNATENTVYSYLDETVTGATAYYRLKQYDVDGSFYYSKIVSITFENNKRPLVYLDASSETLVISSTNSDDEYDLNVFDMKGQEVLSYELGSLQSDAALPFDSFTSGIYTVYLLNKNEMKAYTTNFVKK